VLEKEVATLLGLAYLEGVKKSPLKQGVLSPESIEVRQVTYSPVA